MKWLKMFESFKTEDVLNSILDKINRWGIDSLSDVEKRFLNDSDNRELASEILKKREFIEGLMEYDPRKDEESDFDFLTWTDLEIEEGRWEILYNELEDEDIILFEKIFKVDLKDSDGDYKPWDKLSDIEKNKFKDYILGGLDL
jgi:hypothetical protein